MTVIDKYIAPRSLDQALECLRAGGGVTIVAGGTDVMPQSQTGRLQFKPTLMNIQRVEELHGIARDGDTIRIGALTTITQLMADAVVREHLPILVEAGDHFASDQIRNAGTVGGNIGNASPAGDTLVPLMVLEAEVELATKRNGTINMRRVPIADYFVAPGRTRRAENELLTAVRVPVPPPDHWARFHKFGTRPALDISAISIGIAGVRSAGVLTEVRVAFGAVAPTPVRAPRTEAVLEGKRIDAATIAAAGATARDEIRPIDDVRASAWYRREMVHNMTKRMLEDVAQA